VTVTVKTSAGQLDLVVESDWLCWGLLPLFTTEFAWAVPLACL